MLNRPLHKLIDKLKPKDFWNPTMHDIKEVNEKPYCKFHEIIYQKIDNYMTFKYYLEELKKNDLLNEYPGLEQDDMHHQINGIAPSVSQTTLVKIINMITT